MNAKRGVALLALSLALLPAGCVSETTTRSGALAWKDGTASPAARPPRPAEPRPEARIITLPEDVVREIARFVNGERMLLANRIEVDASRIPFQVAMVPVYDDSYVEKVDLVAPELKATGLLLRSRVDRPLVSTDFPRLRLGDGFDLVATREIQVRTYTSVDERRPAWIRIVGLGDAVYRDLETGRRLERDAITVQAAAVLVGGRLSFRQSVD